MRLFCGHQVSVKLYGEMSRKHEVRCPTCGMTWRGWMPITTDKGKPKRELREAEQRGKMSPKEFFRK